MKSKMRKAAGVMLAATLMASALFGGTYAWQMLGTTARNEGMNLKNPGGRLHDDFNGLNTSVLSAQSAAEEAKVKNVYVENFGEDEIYARIRLEEYLEIGTGAGKAPGTQGKYAASLITKDEDGDGENDVTISDTATWETYQWDPENSDFRDYITLSTGATGRTNGDTVYLPTYNMDQDNIDSDVNGTLAGPDGDILTKKDAYGDYTVYKSGDTEAGVEVWAADEEGQDEIKNAGITAQDLIDAVLDENGALKSTIDGNTTEITLADGTTTFDVPKVKTDATGKVTALYLDLTDDGVENTHIRLLVTEPHKAKATLKTEAFISMEEWENDYNRLAGPYWVYDTDGWVYWAQPIEPQTATGCLLNGIYVAKEEMPNEYYYGLNVVAQFATKDSWKDATDGFAADGTITPEAEALLDTISNPAESGYAAVMTMNVEADRVLRGSTVQFAADITDSGNGQKVEASAIEWKVETIAGAAASLVAEEDVAVHGGETTSISKTGLLSIAANEEHNLKVTAAYTDSAGKLWKGVKILTNLKDSYYDVQLNRTDSVENIVQGSELGYELKVLKVTGANNEAGKNEEAVTPTQIVWSEVEGSVSAGNATKLEATQENAAKAILTIGKDEQSESLKIKVSCTADGDTYQAEDELEVQKEIYTVTVASEETGKMETGATRQYTATVKNLAGNVVEDAVVEWKVEGNESADTKISETGLLTIAENETATPLSIRAIYEDEANEEVYEASMAAGIDLTVTLGSKEIQVGSDETVTLDGMEWYVIAMQDGKALLWSKDVVCDGEDEITFIFGNEQRWKTSSVRKYLNGTAEYQFLNTHRLIDEYAISTPIKTRVQYDGKFEETMDKVFLLSEADIFNTHSKGLKTVTADDYTCRGVLELTASQKKAKTYSFLRSAAGKDNMDAYVLYASGVAGSGSLLSAHGMRPAFWMDLSAEIYDVVVTQPEALGTADQGANVTFDAKVYRDFEENAIMADTVTWSIKNNLSDQTTISQDGVLHIGEDETAEQIEINAAAKVNRKTYIGLATIKVRVQVQIEGKNITVGSTETVQFGTDDMEWYVMAVKDNMALMMSKSVVKENGKAVQMAFADKLVHWKDSDVRTYLNGTFLENHPEIAKAAKKVTIKTMNYLDKNEYLETKDQIFLLTPEDQKQTKFDPMFVQEKYTADQKLNFTDKKVNEYYWSRLAYRSGTVAISQGYKYEFAVAGPTAKRCLRPAFWYDLSNSAE